MNRIRLNARQELDDIISKYFDEKNAPMVLESISIPENKIINLDKKFIESLPINIQDQVKQLIKIINS